MLKSLVSGMEIYTILVSLISCLPTSLLAKKKDAMKYLVLFGSFCDEALGCF